MIPKYEEIRKHAAQSHEFLSKGREYLAAGDVHQASEKGWGLQCTWPEPSHWRRDGSTRGTASFIEL